MVDKSRDKASGTARTDALFTLAGIKIIQAPLRTAQKMARLALPEGASQELVDALTKVKLAQMSIGTKAKTTLKSYGTELASEPFSELAGQLNAGDEINLGELGSEMLGGIGGSMVGQQVNAAIVVPEDTAAATGIGKPADKVVDVASKKTRSAPRWMNCIKVMPPLTMTIKWLKLSKAADVTEYTDQAGDKYNPSLAVDALLPLIELRIPPMRLRPITWNRPCR